MNLIWTFTKWCTRVSLWVFVLPYGMYRSWKHGRRKRHVELIEAIRDQSRYPRPS